MVLQSVAGTLPRIAWSRDEYVALLGNEPDWEAAYRRSAGDETLIFLRLITPWTDKIRSTPAGLYFTLNLRHGIKCFLAMVAATRENLSPAAKAAKLRAVVAPDDRWLLFCTGTIVPDAVWIKFLRLRDRRTMAEAAFEVFAELRQSGTLPSHPRALDGLRDRLYGRPYRCESGEFEVDTEIRKRGFRIFIDDPEKQDLPRDHITVLW